MKGVSTLVGHNQQAVFSRVVKEQEVGGAKSCNPVLGAEAKPGLSSPEPLLTLNPHPGLSLQQFCTLDETVHRMGQSAPPTSTRKEYEFYVRGKVSLFKSLLKERKFGQSSALPTRQSLCESLNRCTQLSSSTGIPTEQSKVAAAVHDCE